MLRRAPLTRTTPLRTRREPKGLGLAQRIAQSLGQAIEHARKPGVWRSEAHRRNVAALRCARCDRPDHSQAAHLSFLAFGMGRGIKVSDALTVPLCADRLLYLGCHSQFDQGLCPESGDIALSIVWLQATRGELRARGQWPEQAETDVERLLGEYLRR